MKIDPFSVPAGSENARKMRMLHFREKSKVFSELFEGKGCPGFVFVCNVMQKRIKGADHGVEFRLLQENVRI